jgi:predicted DNA-binding transcriptional regulator AlpA
MSYTKQEYKIVLGVPDVMKLLGIGRSTAEKIMWGNHFPTIQIGRRKLVHQDVFEQWIKKGESTIDLDSI